MELEADEIQKGQWNLNLLHQGARYNGNLVITNKHVYYEIKHEVVSSGVTLADGLLKIQRSEIDAVQSYRKYLIFQRFSIQLKNGERYEFDRGVMSTAKIMDLLNA